MKKKIILKYILIYLPFIIGIGLYSFGIYNIYSSLLFFLGGYISLKNTIDIRKINRNINSINYNNIKKDNINNISKENILYPPRIKKISRVRKKIKN